MFATDQSMHTHTKKLIKALDQLASLLEIQGEHLWSEWMRRSQSMLSNGDSAGIDYLLGAYGGMGSFNDLVFGLNQASGDNSQTNKLDSNHQLENLRHQAWLLAQKIKRSAGGV
jgi:hypothetical protein